MGSVNVTKDATIILFTGYIVGYWSSMFNSSETTNSSNYFVKRLNIDNKKMLAVTDTLWEFLFVYAYVYAFLTEMIEYTQFWSHSILDKNCYIIY